MEEINPTIEWKSRISALMNLEKRVREVPNKIQLKLKSHVYLELHETVKYPLPRIMLNHNNQHTDSRYIIFM